MSEAETTADETHEQDHGARAYWVILGWLSLLTVVEVVAAMLPRWIPGMSKWTLGAILVPMSTAKIILIAGFFMHVKFDTKRLWWIVASPVAFSFCLFAIPLWETLSKQAG